jgi:hypothetical protein
VRESLADCYGSVQIRDAIAVTGRFLSELGAKFPLRFLEREDSASHIGLELQEVMRPRSKLPACAHESRQLREAFAVARIAQHLRHTGAFGV